MHRVRFRKANSLSLSPSLFLWSPVHPAAGVGLRAYITIAREGKYARYSKPKIRGRVDEFSNFRYFFSSSSSSFENALTKESGSVNDGEVREESLTN